MLRKMETKGVVVHRVDGRRFLYAPTVSAPDVTYSMVADLADRLFGGDVAALACHLIEEHEVGAADLDDLRRRIDSARKERRR
jgi:predicted transcriptional regulator